MTEKDNLTTTPERVKLVHTPKDIYGSLILNIYHRMPRLVVFVVCVCLIANYLINAGCLKENTADKYGHTKRRYN